jgi:hypothetical protein
MDKQKTGEDFGVGIGIIGNQDAGQLLSGEVKKVGRSQKRGL